HSRQDQSHSVQSLARDTVRMLRLGPDREILRSRFRRRLCFAGAHAAWPRHSGRLRPAQKRDRKTLGARAPGASGHGDDGLTAGYPPMSLLARIVMAFIAYVLACIAAALVMTIGSFARDWNELMISLGLYSAAAQSAALWWITGVADIIIFMIGFLPAALVIALTEGLALRSSIVYGVVGAALALAIACRLGFAGY